VYACTGSQCIENAVRLRGGSTPFEGRVEVCLGGVWGSICLRGWNSFDAIVTCRQLGFSTQGEFSPIICGDTNSSHY